MASKCLGGRTHCGDTCKNDADDSFVCFAGCHTVTMRRGSHLVKSIQNYIDGKFVAGAREFDDVNPADGSVIARVSEAEENLVDSAVQVARKALQGEWGKFGVRERTAI